MSRYSTNKEAWEKIFEDFNILEEIDKNGFFKITSKQINEYREARLMTKFDNSEAIPEILDKNKLSILPISSNSYMISTFCTYKKFEKTPREIIQMNFPSYIESIDYSQITSEALALNCAYISEILKDFLKEDGLVPTVCGKMGSGNFSFKIKDISSNNYINVSVENSRIEIDGGYEGFDSLAIVEAKNVVAKDFLVRQLYYPYRLWKSKITKRVRPIFIIYSNGIFTIYEYKFNDDNEYSSIELVNSKRYSIENTEINLETIKELLESIQEFEKEPNISFPQANNFERVINICELVEEKEKDKKEIKENYEFVERQTNYYTDAAIYLGLLKKNGTRNKSYELTEKGRKIMRMNYQDRQIEFAKAILSHKVFNETIKQYFLKLEMPTDNEIVEYMKGSNLYNVGSDSTYYRRASTIKAWINWIIELAN